MSKSGLSIKQAHFLFAKLEDREKLIVIYRQESKRLSFVMAMSWFVKSMSWTWDSDTRTSHLGKPDKLDNMLAMRANKTRQQKKHARAKSRYDAAKANAPSVILRKATTNS